MEKKIRWALIGCGDIAEKATAPAINADPNSVLQAAVRRDPAKLKDFAARYRSRTAYTDFADAIRDPEVDAVYVATPVALHRPQTVQACEAGKHVLCEKPMALNAVECAEMVAAARANGVCAVNAGPGLAHTSGVKLGVSYYRRLYPKMARVKELLDQNAIGRPLVVRVDLQSWNPPPTDRKIWRVHPKESGGGVLTDVGSHRLDLLVHFFGMPEWVAGRTATLVHEYEAEDAATAMLGFANGLSVVVSFLWSSRVKLDEFDIAGSEGRIQLLPLDGPELRLTRNGKTEVEMLPPPANRHELLIKDFTSAVLAGREPVVSGEEGRKTSLIMDAIYRSSATKRLVHLREV